jgi:hypothetical protein
MGAIVADKRIGFLLVLKLLPERKTLAPHLLNCLEVVEVQAVSRGTSQL